MLIHNLRNQQFVSSLYDSVVHMEQNDLAILRSSASSSANPPDGQVIISKMTNGYRTRNFKIVYQKIIEDRPTKMKF